MTLQSLGWNSFFAIAFARYRLRGYEPARVAVEHKTLYRVYTESGELPAVLSGAFLYNTHATGDFPAVGDWVAIARAGEKAVIHAVLPRKSRFSRTVAGGTSNEQIAAANIDVLFLAMSLNRDFNLRRLERYLTMAWNGGASPVIVLTKADLCDDVVELTEQVRRSAGDVPVYAVSAAAQQGMDALRDYLKPGVTIAVLGSSGVGKSTLINALADDELSSTGATAFYKDRGRHTTTHRELIVLDGGGIIIDTPGMRELRLWDGEGGLEHTFADITALAASCRFADCSHTAEPGCAVLAAVDDGTVDEGRYGGFLKLQRETAYYERRQKKARRMQRAKAQQKPKRRFSPSDEDDE